MAGILEESSWAGRGMCDLVWLLMWASCWFGGQVGRHLLVYLRQMSSRPMTWIVFWLGKKKTKQKKQSLHVARFARKAPALFNDSRNRIGCLCLCVCTDGRARLASPRSPPGASPRTKGRFCRKYVLVATPPHPGRRRVYRADHHRLRVTKCVEAPPPPSYPGLITAYFIIMSPAASLLHPSSGRASRKRGLVEGGGGES